MTYKPKPGDLVTCPVLIGEWKVMNVGSLPGFVVLSSEYPVPCEIMAHESNLVPVAPQEPPIGTVVRAFGVLWQRDQSGRDNSWFSPGAPGATRRGWSELAKTTDLAPVVFADDVADWIERQVESRGRVHIPTLVKDLRAAFGWTECGQRPCEHAPDGGNHPVTG